MATKTKEKEAALTPAEAPSEELIPFSVETEGLIREINEIKTATYRFLEAAVYQANRNCFEIGERLCKLKEQCKHGEWLVALAQVDYSEDTAQRMMKIYREYNPNIKAFQDLNYSQLVALFPVPVDQREAFVVDNGISKQTTTEIRKLIKQKETAEKENARLSGLLETAIEGRKKEQQAAFDYKDQKDKALAENKELKKSLESQKKDLFKDASEIDKLKKEIEELKAAPPTEVKVFEPSQQQIEQIRKKAYEEAKADADKEARAMIDSEVEKRCAIYDEQMQRKVLEEDPGIQSVNLILNQLLPLLGLMSSELDKIDDPAITQKALRGLEASMVEFFGEAWSRRREDQ